VIRVAEREALRDRLRPVEIGCGTHFPVRVHRQRATRLWSVGPRVTERATPQILSLPIIRSSPARRSASQKANCRGTMPPLSWIYVLSDLDGTGRWVSCWFSFWCWAVARMRVRTFSGIIHGSGSLIPGWVGANSRLALLREFARKGVIYLTIFPAKRPLSEESRRNSRLGGKSREICPHRRQRAAAPLSRQQSRLSASLSAG
jgi:hypothetical protein